MYSTQRESGGIQRMQFKKSLQWRFHVKLRIWRHTGLTRTSLLRTSYMRTDPSGTRMTFACFLQTSAQDEWTNRWAEPAAWIYVYITSHGPRIPWSRADIILVSLKISVCVYIINKFTICVPLRIYSGSMPVTCILISCRSPDSKPKELKDVQRRLASVDQHHWTGMGSGLSAVWRCLTTAVMNVAGAPLLQPRDDVTISKNSKTYAISTLYHCPSTSWDAFCSRHYTLHQSLHFRATVVWSINAHICETQMNRNSKEV